VTSGLDDEPIARERRVDGVLAPQRAHHARGLGVRRDDLGPGVPAKHAPDHAAVVSSARSPCRRFANPARAAPGHTAIGDRWHIACFG